MSLGDIIAQPAALRVLRSSLASERLASAYLFEGPSGVGKERTAIGLGQAMLCTEKPREGCGSCSTCQRVASGAHPDVRVFRPRDEGDRNIQVEVLRAEILPIAQFAPFEAPAALLVFPDADISFPSEHAEAANALLKTLEEPRQGVHFALLATRPERLLPTIRSRCQRVRFHRLPPPTLDRVLVEHGVPEQVRGLAIALADGRADRALALAQEGRASMLVEQALRVDGACAAARPGTIVEVASDLAGREDLALILEAVGLFYRDVAAAALGSGPASGAFDAEANHIRERASVLGAERASARYDRVQCTMAALERNAAAEIALDALLFELQGI